jgi:hypothetical protein
MVQAGKDALLVQGTVDKAGWLPGYYWWSWVECEGNEPLRWFEDFCLARGL